MKIERKHKCQSCKKEFEWFYQVPQRNGFGFPEAEEIPKDKALVHYVKKSIEKDGYKMPVELMIYCPYCDELNEIEVEY